MLAPLIWGHLSGVKCHIRRGESAMLREIKGWRGLVYLCSPQAALGAVCFQWQVMKVWVSVAQCLLGLHKAVLSVTAALGYIEKYGFAYFRYKWK